MARFADRYLRRRLGSSPVMRGLCAPSEQGNTADGLWLEHKEVLRLRKIAVNYEHDMRYATMRGTLIGVTVAFLLMALINSGTAGALS